MGKDYVILIFRLSARWLNYHNGIPNMGNKIIAIILLADFLLHSWSKSVNYAWPIVLGQKVIILIIGKSH
jgi:hypothetical protein